MYKKWYCRIYRVKIGAANSQFGPATIHLINKVLFVLILCKGLKNEDGYEISIPCEDNTLDESGFYNQSDHTFDGIYSALTLLTLLCCDRVTCLIITIELYTLLCSTNQCFCRVGLRSGSSLQSVPSDYQPQSTTADFSGKEHLAPKTHRRSGGGEGLPALPAWQIHFQHQESGEQWLNGER